eukprot:GILJ01025397.1.p1 GENE.GILJ01025397.1~~GILJ01025397.1.p1  ORF type:complete len:127 (+),score=15.55 GILJ01025397.1:53-382(+)
MVYVENRASGAYSVRLSVSPAQDVAEVRLQYLSSVGAQQDVTLTQDSTNSALYSTMFMTPIQTGARVAIVVVRTDAGLEEAVVESWCYQSFYCGAGAVPCAGIPTVPSN